MENDKIDWFIEEKMREISERSQTMTHTEPASFTCGYNAGYKKCIQDLVRFLND